MLVCWTRGTQEASLLCWNNIHGASDLSQYRTYTKHFNCSRCSHILPFKQVYLFIISSILYNSKEGGNGFSKLPDNRLCKNFLLFVLSSCFFSKYGGTGRRPLPFSICPGEGKGGFGIEGQLRPGFIEELTVVEQVGPTAGFNSAPSIFGCIFSTLTVMLQRGKQKDRTIGNSHTQECLFYLNVYFNPKLPAILIIAIYNPDNKHAKYLAFCMTQLCPP